MVTPDAAKSWMTMADSSTSTRRKFLVIVDDTPECQKALRFAWRRAKNTGGGITLLRTVNPVDFQQWLAVEEKMREEAQAEAEELLRSLAGKVHADSGILPELVVRQGEAKQVILQLIEEDPGVRILVLGAGTSADGPGPLVSMLVGKMAGQMHVPITVVPGNLSDEQLDELT
jgi:nucleotide-binding universal stress UspA family protein